MCGIAGIVSLNSRDTINESRLRRMRDVITHRGPDGAGLWIEAGVGLAHRRLAIVDVAGGHQPMANEDDSVWITFNGEIYNHADLRPSLEARGHHYRTRSDTETILHLYEEYGDRCVEHLRGMFAFAIWDRRQRRVLIARDRLGIKPLYYATTERELIFGSEIKALLASDAIRPEFNRAALPEFLATRFVSGEETLFRGIRKLQPGHTLSWSAETGVVQRRYWQIPGPSADPARSFETEAADLRERLLAAVKRHLMSDVPLGVFLSGGIDSSALAAMTAGMATDRLQTFSVGFAEQEANELPFARTVAAHIGSEHREVLVSAPEYFEALPKLIWQEDEPIAFTSSVPLYFVSKLASAHVKVVLTGEGADELFLGYNRYRVTLWNQRLGWPYWALMPRAGRDAVRRSLVALPKSVRRYASRMFLGLEPGVRSLFLENFAVFPDAMRRDLIAGSDADGGRDPYRTMLACFAEGQGGLLDRLSRTDLQTYMHELLMKQDQMSMAASIESRVPFLDDSIVEHVAALPGRLKLRGWQTKAIMRAAVAPYIPKAILTRKKMGFPVPIGGWLRGSHQSVVDEFVLGGRARERQLFDHDAVDRLVAEHRSGARDHGDRLWLLVNLEMWQRIFMDGEEPARVMRPVGRRVSVSYADSLGQDGRTVATHFGRSPA
jgi:asparagine synthase (glutamine-hydrolysing)